MITKTITGVLLIAMLSLPFAQLSYAKTDAWEAAGLILAGALGYAVINEIATNNSRPRHYVGVPVYPAYERTPVVRTYHISQPPRRVWIPGYYETVTEKVWIPGYWEDVYIPPETRRVWVSDSRGRGYWKEMTVRPGHRERIWREGYYEYRDVRVWVEGRYEYR